jgi:hypothetical protein
LTGRADYVPDLCKQFNGNWPRRPDLTAQAAVHGYNIDSLAAA